MARLRNNGKTCSKFRRLAMDFKIPKNHGKRNKMWMRDYQNEVKFLMQFISILIAGGAQYSPCGNFLTNKTGAFYTKVILFKNKQDKRNDKKICDQPIWGKHGSTPSSAAKHIRRYIKEREKLNFKISTKDFSIKHTEFPVNALCCEQNVHYEKGEFISHAYSVIMKRNFSSDGKRDGFTLIQKDSVDTIKPYKYVEKMACKVHTQKIMIKGPDYQNVEIAEKAECLQQAYYDCARALDGAF